MACETEVVVQGLVNEVVVLDSDTELVVGDEQTILELPSAAIEILEVGIQGPTGPPGSSASIEIDFGTLIAAATATIDSVLIATERCVTWQVCVETTGGGKSQTWTVVAVNDGSTAVNHMVFGKVRAPLAGGPLSIATVVDISAGSMRLRLTNNEAFSVDISVTRISISP